jgi:hypothetical protein
MALITLSALLADVKGKLGGGVFQNSQGGLALRTKVTPINRRTMPQNRSRIAMFNLQNDWLSMTQAQRDDWDLWAVTYPRPQKKNPLKNINGQQYFLKYNDYRKAYSLPVMKDINWDIPTFTAVEATIGYVGGLVFITTDRAIDFVNEFLVFSMSWEVSAGLNNPGNRRKLLSFTTAQANNNFIHTQLIDTFGAVPAVGSEVFIKIAVFSRTSPYWTMFYETKTTIYQLTGIGQMIIGTNFVVS